jgi:protein-S-isoprenylcysteine O-methyltransferase Ste14
MNMLELKVPPLALAALLAAAMGLVARLSPALTFAFPGRGAATFVLATAGVFICLAGVVAFRRSRTTVDPTSPETSSTLVVSGLYRQSRNPMYVGFLSVLAAWACHLSNPLAFVALPVFVGYLNRFQIAPEEQALRAKFGGAYAEYEKTVRRWL